MGDSSDIYCRTTEPPVERNDIRRRQNFPQNDELSSADGGTMASEAPCRYSVGNENVCGSLILNCDFGGLNDLEITILMGIHYARVGSFSW